MGHANNDQHLVTVASFSVRPSLVGRLFLSGGIE
jgi:hypothetical protein